MTTNTYLDRLPAALRKQGDAAHGEIEILSAHGKGEFGILYEDKYIMLVRDRVLFPGGQEGGYVRIIQTGELTGSCGTVIVPIWQDKIVFVRIFRHATRDWEWELPRGFQEPHVSEQENAAKEVFEELGVQGTAFRKIGTFNANTGLLTGLIGVYVVELAADPEKIGRPARDESIASFRSVPCGEITNLATSGEIRCGISLAALFLYLNAKR